MCGIVGYVGQRPCLELLLGGLERLEYRGYDSAGISVIKDHQLYTQKTAGKIAGLEKLINSNGKVEGVVGLGHTRWATHGAPNTTNAHPHHDMSGNLALVHNGIIENYATLKRQLQEAGIKFETDTDSEVLVQLVGHFYKGGPLPTRYRKGKFWAVRGLLVLAAGVMTLAYSLSGLSLPVIAFNLGAAASLLIRQKSEASETQLLGTVDLNGGSARGQSSG